MTGLLFLQQWLKLSTEETEVSQALKGIIVCYFKSMSHEHTSLEMVVNCNYLAIEEKICPSDIQVQLKHS
jgi:hypothetical protein